MEVFTAKNITFSLVSDDEIQELLAHIKKIMQEKNSHNLSIFSEKLWRWQYRTLPSSKSYVFVAKYNGVISGYYHAPIYNFMLNGQEKTVAMVQDVAISERLRGQGIFRRLAEFAHLHFSTENIDFIYTFPNKRSIHNFLKYDKYNKVANIGVYIRPLKTSAIISSKIRLFGLEKPAGFIADTLLNFFKQKKDTGCRVGINKNFSPEIVLLFEQFTSSHKITLLRNEAWLKWRFLEKPNSQHYILSLTNSSKVLAVAIFKADVILGNPALILMDFAFLLNHEASLLQIIQEVAINHKKLLDKNVNLIFACSLHPVIKKLCKIGFIRLPKRFVTREFNLLSRTINLQNDEPLKTPENWHITLADWDVF